MAEPKSVNRDLAVMDPAKVAKEGKESDYEKVHKEHLQALNELDVIASTILAVVWSGGGASEVKIGLGRRDQGAIVQKTVAVVQVGGKLVVAANGVSWSDVKYQPMADLKTLTAAWDKVAEYHESHESLAKAMKDPGQKQVLDRFYQHKRMHPDWATNKDAMDRGLKPDDVRFSPREQVKEVLKDDIKGEIEFINPPEDTAYGYHAEMQLLSYLFTNKLQPDGDLMGVSKPCCPCCASWLAYFGIEFSTRHDKPGEQWTPPKSVTSDWRRAKQAKFVDAWGCTTKPQ